MAKKPDAPNDYRQMSGALNNPFATLNLVNAANPVNRGESNSPDSPHSPHSSHSQDSPHSPDSRRPRPRVPRAVIRMERAGRGGKEVTVVDHLDLQPTEFERWLKQLKSGLGCGGVVEGRTLVLQGDQRKRLPKLLEALGVGKVIVG